MAAPRINPSNESRGMGYVTEVERKALSKLDARLSPPHKHKPTFSELLQQPGDSQLKRMFWGAFKFHFFLKVVVQYKVWLNAKHEEALKQAQAEARSHKKSIVRGYEEDLDMHSHIPDWEKLADEDLYKELEDELDELYKELELAYLAYMEIMAELTESYAQEEKDLFSEMFDFDENLAEHHHEIEGLLNYSIHPSEVEHPELFDHEDFTALLNNLRNALRMDYITSPLRKDFVRDQALPALAGALCLCGVKDVKHKVKDKPVVEWVQDKFMGIWQRQAAAIDKVAEAQLKKIESIEKRIEKTLSSALTKLGAVNAFKAHDEVMKSHPVPKLKPMPGVGHRPER